MSYTNVTRGGMSGGPVIDAGGRVVAIHGIGGTASSTSSLADLGIAAVESVSPQIGSTIRDLSKLIKTGFNYAIPINTFLQLLPQSGLYLGLQVENTPAPELGAALPPNWKPPEADGIGNVGKTLNTINQGLETIQRVRGLFGF
jgi:serine protease Do